MNSKEMDIVIGNDVRYKGNEGGGRKRNESQEEENKMIENGWWIMRMKYARKGQKKGK